MKSIAIIFAIITIFGGLLITIMNQQLTYPLDEISKRIIKDIVADPNFMRSVIIKTLWENTEIYNPMFESLDGLSLTGTVPTLNDTGITMTTDTVANSVSGIIKDGLSDFHLTFAKWSAFRVRAEWQAGSLTASTGHFIVGAYTANAGANANFYGFTVSGTTLNGVTCNSDTGTPTTMALMTIATTPSVYELEARYTPGKSVVFLVNGVEKGIITTTLPYSDFEEQIGAIMDWEIKTTNTDAKTVIMGAYSFIQERYTNK